VEEMAGLYIITAVLMVIGVVISCFEKHGEKKRRQEKLQKSKISTAIKMQVKEPGMG
jgi:undecaprenyl pyrophosphate phosphatase UppP